MTDDLRRRLVELSARMRNCSRYKSHDLGFVDSVSANTVDDWADELDALLASEAGPSCTVVELKDHPAEPVSARCILDGCQDWWSKSLSAQAPRGWQPMRDFLGELRREHRQCIVNARVDNRCPRCYRIDGLLADAHRKVNPS